MVRNPDSNISVQKNLYRGGIVLTTAAVIPIEIKGIVDLVKSLPDTFHNSI